MSQAQGSLQQLFSQLDQLRELLTVIEAGFTITSGSVTVIMPQEQIAKLKNDYKHLLLQIENTAHTFPVPF